MNEDVTQSPVSTAIIDLLNNALARVHFEAVGIRSHHDERIARRSSGEVDRANHRSTLRPCRNRAYRYESENNQKRSPRRITYFHFISPGSLCLRIIVLHWALEKPAAHLILTGA